MAKEHITEAAKTTVSQMSDFQFKLKAFQQAASRIEWMHNLLVLDNDKIEICDDGTLDTVFAYEDIELRYNDIDRDENGQVWEVPDHVIADMQEECYQRFHEAFLSLDYRSAADTHDGRPFYSLLISWGGPSEEIRVYQDDTDFANIYAEFWYLDWFKGQKTFSTQGSSDNSVVLMLRTILCHFLELETFKKFQDEDCREYEVY